MFDTWDKVKGEGLALVSEMWNAHKKARGAKLARAKKQFVRAEKQLRAPNACIWHRQRLLNSYHSARREYELLLEKALWEKAEIKQTARILYNGKVNDTFFRQGESRRSAIC